MVRFTMYALFALLLLALVVYGVLLVWRGTKPSPRVTAITLAVWLVALAVMTLRPAGGEIRLNLVPFFISGWWSPFDIIANAAVFLPLGLILAVAGWRALPTIAVGLAVSLSIEIVQYVVDVGRTADINDLVTNTAGAALGWLIAWTIRRARSYALRSA